MRYVVLDLETVIPVRGLIVEHVDRFGEQQIVVRYREIRIDEVVLSHKPESFVKILKIKSNLLRKLFLLDFKLYIIIIRFYQRIIIIRLKIQLIFK